MATLSNLLDNLYVGFTGSIGFTGSAGFTGSVGFTGSEGLGVTGGSADKVFYENDQTVTTNYTLTSGKNAMSAGPITINSGITVTVGAGQAWTVV
jgi:hypothetical protein